MPQLLIVFFVMSLGHTIFLRRWDAIFMTSVGPRLAALPSCPGQSTWAQGTEDLQGHPKAQTFMEPEPIGITSALVLKDCSFRGVIQKLWALWGGQSPRTPNEHGNSHSHQSLCSPPCLLSLTSQWHNSVPVQRTENREVDGIYSLCLSLKVQESGVLRSESRRKWMAQLKQEHETALTSTDDCCSDPRSSHSSIPGFGSHHSTSILARIDPPTLSKTPDIKISDVQKPLVTFVFHFELLASSLLHCDLGYGDSWRGPDHQLFLVLLMLRLHQISAILGLPSLLALIISGYRNVFIAQGQCISVMKFRAKSLVLCVDTVSLRTSQTDL